MIAGVDKKAGALFSGLQSAFLPGAFQGSDYRGSHGRYPPAFLFGQVDGLCGFRADEKDSSSIRWSVIFSVLTG